MKLTLNMQMQLQHVTNIQTFKLVVKTIARKHGLHATFMPKPLFGVNWIWNAL